MVLNLARLLHQPAQGSLGIGASREQEDAEPLAQNVGVNALPDGACGVAAPHRERLNEQVRERMQQHVGSAGKETLAFPILGPLQMSARKRGDSLLDRGA